MFVGGSGFWIMTPSVVADVGRWQDRSLLWLARTGRYLRAEPGGENPPSISFDSVNGPSMMTGFLRRRCRGPRPLAVARSGLTSAPELNESSLF